MLAERVFIIGGVLSIVAGAAFLLTFLAFGTGLLIALIPTGGFLVGFGVFFVYVGRGARNARQRLLDSPRPPP